VFANPCIVILAWIILRQLFYKYSLYRGNSALFNLGKIILLDVYLSFLYVLFWHGLNFTEYSVETWIMDFVLQNLFLDNIAQTTHFSLEFALNRISLFIIFRVLGFKFCRNTVKNVNFSLRSKQLFECILNGCVQFSKYCQFTVDSAY
jgi:hypothetical protein